jgi:hypothetical protein
VESAGPYDRVRAPEGQGQGQGQGHDGVIRDSFKRGEKEGARYEHGEGGAWHWHTNQRHMMKAELDDAFRMRNRVAVGILSLVLAFLAGCAWVVGWFWGYVRGTV